jgi:glycosyltransferase involved in cell wall biosynthesis
MLDGLLPQLSDGDEVLVIGDGPRPKLREICAAYKSDLIQYWEIPLTMNYGNPQRNEAIARAKGTHIHFLDDDDLTKEGAIADIKAAAAEHPLRPLMFKMHHHSTILWATPEVKRGNISGQLFVAPNVPGRLGRWSGKYDADFDFISSTLQLYPEGYGALVWRDEIVAIQGQAGPVAGGGREM